MFTKQHKFSDIFHHGTVIIEEQFLVTFESKDTGTWHLMKSLLTLMRLQENLANSRHPEGR